MLSSSLNRRLPHGGTFFPGRTRRATGTQSVIQQGEVAPSTWKVRRWSPVDISARPFCSAREWIGRLCLSSTLPIQMKGVGRDEA